MFNSFIEIEISDHAFAFWLSNRGWQGKTESEDSTVSFFTEDKLLLAKVVYDDVNLTRRIFINPIVE